MPISPARAVVLPVAKRSAAGRLPPTPADAETGGPGSRFQSGEVGRELRTGSSCGQDERVRPDRVDDDDCRRVGTDPGFTGVKPGPGVISDGELFEDLCDRWRAVITGIVRVEFKRRSTSLLADRASASVTFPALSATEARTLSTQQCQRPTAGRRLASQRRIGTRRHAPAPSTWYSRTNDLRSRFSSLTSQRTDARLPRRPSAPAIATVESCRPRPSSLARSSRPAWARPCRQWCESGPQTSTRRRAPTGT